jgi:hypothetical protein
MPQDSPGSMAEAGDWDLEQTGLTSRKRFRCASLRQEVRHQPGSHWRGRRLLRRHLVSMLGVLDGKGVPEDKSPVNRESAKVQCVVARAAPSDLVIMGRERDRVIGLFGIHCRKKRRRASTDNSSKLRRSRTSRPRILLFCCYMVTPTKRCLSTSRK